MPLMFVVLPKLSQMSISYIYVGQKLQVLQGTMGPGAEMIVTGDLEGFCNLFSSILSVEGKTCSMQCKPEPPGGHFRKYSCKRLILDGSVLHCMLPKGEIVLPFNRPNKTKQITKTLKVTWGYHFIPRSHGPLEDL